MPKGQYKRSEEQLERWRNVNVGREPWNKGKKGLQQHSDETKKILSEFRTGNQYAKGSVRTKEHKEAISRAHSGENNWNWKGGCSRDTRNDKRYKKWRANIFARDDWTCQTCSRRSCSGDKVYIEAHHINSWAQYPEERYDLENGVTLCKECHALTDNFKGKNNDFSKD